MKNYKKIIVAIAMLGIVGMGYFSYTVYQAFLGKNTDFKGTYEVYINTDSSYEQAFKKIAPALTDKTAFHNVASRKGYPKNVKPGRFVLEEGMSNNDIVNTLRSQNQPITISFNNQARIENLAGRLAAQLEKDSTAILSSLTDSVFLAENNYDRASALGMYMPYNYKMYWNASADQIRGKLWQAHQRFWTKQRKEKAESLGLSPREVSTLASIVQKETTRADEQPRVAGLYLNRLRKGWLLQADPTVIYAKKRQENDYNQVVRRVLTKDLKLDDPYNTYLQPGLPPGPIVLPDISAIKAVLNPESHDYMYMAADPERPGYHKFAKTNHAHNINARAYHRWLNKQGISH